MKELNYKVVLKADYFIFPEEELSTRKRPWLKKFFVPLLGTIVICLAIIYLIIYFCAKIILPSKVFAKIKSKKRLSREEKIQEFKESFKETEINVCFKEYSYVYDSHEFKYQEIEKVLETESMFYLLHKKKRFKKSQKYILVPKENCDTEELMSYIKKKQEIYPFKIEKSISERPCFLTGIPKLKIK